MFKDCMGTTEINAETPSRRDAEKIENILAAQVIDAAWVAQKPIFEVS